MEEIRSSPALRAFGAALMGSHAAKGIQWIYQGVTNPIRSAYVGTCRPSAPFCHEGIAQVWLQGAAGLLLMVGAIFFLRLFSKPEKTRGACLGLLALLVFRTAFSVWLYDGLENYFFAGLFVFIAYLFLPRKKELLPCLLVLSFVGSALLKLNHDWLSGESLPLAGLRGTQLAIALYLMVLAEGGFSLLLLSRKKQRRITSVALIALVHVGAYLLLGVSFPYMLLTMLSYFVLADLDGPVPDLLGEIFSLRISRSSALVLGAFALSQVLPLFAARSFPSARTLGANDICYDSALVKNKGGYSHLTKIVNPGTSRLPCDPEPYLDKVRTLCRAEENPEISFVLRARKPGEDTFTELVNLPDACHSEQGLGWRWLLQAQSIQR